LKGDGLSQGGLACPSVAHWCKNQGSVSWSASDPSSLRFPHHDQVPGRRGRSLPRFVSSLGQTGPSGTMRLHSRIHISLVSSTRTGNNLPARRRGDDQVGIVGRQNHLEWRRGFREREPGAGGVRGFQSRAQESAPERQMDTFLFRFVPQRGSRRVFRFINNSS